MKRPVDACPGDLASLEGQQPNSEELEQVDEALSEDEPHPAAKRLKQFKYEGKPDWLCQRCESLDLNKIFDANKHQNEISSRRVMKLGKLGTRSQETMCPLCEFFDSMKPKSRHVSHEPDFALYVVRPPRYFNGNPGLALAVCSSVRQDLLMKDDFIKETGVIAVVETGENMPSKNALRA